MFLAGGPPAKIWLFVQGAITRVHAFICACFGLEKKREGNMAIIPGTPGDDTLIGTFFDDGITGLAGNDSISAGDGNDHVQGGPGNDTILGEEGNDILSGDADNDVLDGGAGDDQLTGATGDDSLDGADGNDLLDGGMGNDILLGHDGDDPLNGGAGDDLLDGGGGSDGASYQFAASSVSVDLTIVGPQAVGGGQGIDTLVSIENITGSRFNDTLIGDSNDNLLNGGAGSDMLNGGAGNDTASFAAAAATSGVTVDLRIVGPQAVGGSLGIDNLISIENLIGTRFDDTLIGDLNDNVLRGGVLGNDTLIGNGGNDTLVGNTGDDVLDGGGGGDTADFSGANADLVVSLLIAGAQDVGGGLGLDTLISIENLTGGNFNDVLVGNGEHNVLFGLDGDDFLSGGAGDDELDGGAGSDTADYSSDTAGVRAVLDAHMVKGALTGTDQFSGIENIVGGSGDDKLQGDGNANVLIGNAGDDALSGKSGDDILIGGAGADVVSGGSGADQFVFLAGDIAAGDIIADFHHTQFDKIDLSGVDFFNFIGTSEFSAIPGAAELRYAMNEDGGVTVEGDTDHDGLANFSFTIANVSSVTAEDFIF
jgi:Ca2+-binding RTX toxin-like protein